MKYLKVILGLLIFIGITITFNYFFRMVFTPAGKVGKPTNINVTASALYIAAWTAMSVVAGFKGCRSILEAAVIYSGMPFIGFLGSFFMGTPLAYIVMIIFYWGVPVQGINYGLLFLQLPICIFGYMAGSRLKILKG